MIAIKPCNLRSRGAFKHEIAGDEWLQPQPTPNAVCARSASMSLSRLLEEGSATLQPVYVYPHHRRATPPALYLPRPKSFFVYVPSLCVTTEREMECHNEPEAVGRGLFVAFTP